MGSGEAGGSVRLSLAAESARSREQGPHTQLCSQLAVSVRVPLEKQMCEECSEDFLLATRPLWSWELGGRGVSLDPRVCSPPGVRRARWEGRVDVKRR